MTRLVFSERAGSMLVRASILVALPLLAGCGYLLPKIGGSATAPAQVAAAPVSPVLTTAEVQATFGTGVGFTETVVGGKTYSMVLNMDGTAKRTPTGGKAESGTWRAADLGYCSKWGGQKTDQCYSVKRTAAAGTWDIVDGKMKVVAHFTKP